MQAWGIKKQKKVSLQSLILVALRQQKAIQCAKDATVFMTFSHQSKLSSQELGGLSSDENNLQCKNVPTMLNTAERMEEQKLYVQIFVSSNSVFC